MPAHVHNYQLLRSETKTVDGEKVTYNFYECVGEGNCDKPNKMEIKR